MGSFGVGCAISNLAINEGDKVGFMIIGQKERWNSPYPSKGNRSSYTYTTDVYKPFLPAIFGKYDDYGRIGDIVPSETTKLIEKLFHRPIDVVMNIVCSDDVVYSLHSGIFKNYFMGNKKTFHDTGDTPIEVSLSKLGFTLESEQEDGVKVFRFEQYGITSHGNSRWAIWDNTRPQPLKDKFYSSDIKYLMEFFGEATGIYPGFDRNDYNAIKMLKNLSGTFFLEEVYHDIEKFMLNDKYESRKITNQHDGWATFISILNRYDMNSFEFYDATIDSVVRDFMTRETVFPWHDLRTFSSYANIDELVSMNTLISMLTSLNRMLIPSFCGEQHGNDSMSAALNVSTGAILERREQDSLG